MNKSFLQSKTIVSALIGLMLTSGVTVGVVTESEAKDFTEAVIELSPYLGIILSLLGTIYGRIKAKGDVNKFFS